MKHTCPNQVAARLCLAITLSAAAWGTGCAASLGSAPGSVLAKSLREIQPMNDRDHYVYVWQRMIDGKRAAAGVQVEHVSALADDEFEIAISEDGKASGRLRVHFTDDVLEVLEEDDLPQSIRLSYSPPLPQLQAPLLVGEVEATSTATVRNLATDEDINAIEVKQTVRTRATRRIESAVADFDMGVAVRTQRTLITPAGAIELESATVLVPGVGEIRSESSATAVVVPDGASTAPPTVVTRRELACAIVAGKAIGDCGQVGSMLAKWKGLGK